MPISINNLDSMDNEDQLWFNIPELNYHMKSFNEVFYDQCENQSLKDKITFMSIENEAVYDQEALLNSSKIKNFGYAIYQSANERLGDIINTNAFSGITNYKLREKYDSTCSSFRNYWIKPEEEEKILVGSKYPHYKVGELVCSKLRYKELMKLEELVYKIGNIQIDYKPNQIAENDNSWCITSAHIHNSFSNENGNRKMVSKNGYRFLQDLKDKITMNLKLPLRHNAYFRYLGYNTWCKRGNNLISQRNQSGDRYFDLNDCWNIRMNHGQGKRLKTLENRSFTIFRKMDMTLEAIRMYHNGINKFLAFYKDVSASTMETKDLYLRMDNKAHKFKELVIPKNHFSTMNNDNIRIDTSISLREIRDQNITEEN